MMRRTSSTVLLMVCILGCTRSGSAVAEPVGPARPSSEPSSTAAVASTTAAVASTPPMAPTAEERDLAFVPDVQAIAKAYKAWGRVDDELRWAPFLCRMPLPGRPAFSVAATGGHAQKLYSLFAKDREAYRKRERQALGQVLVKESFAAERVEGEAPLPAPTDAGLGEGDHFNPFIVRGGTTFRAGKLMGLYVMMKKAGAATDDGWVYGTITADGTVTSAGKVASCMGCHRDAPHDRLFGVKVGGY